MNLSRHETKTICISLKKISFIGVLLCVSSIKSIQVCAFSNNHISRTSTLKSIHRDLRRDSFGSVLSLQTLQMNKDEHSEEDATMFHATSITRRQALFTSLTAATMIMTSTTEPSNAIELEDIAIGQGKWISTPTSTASAKLMNKIVTPNFVTYLTRFLITYDDAISQWWKDTKVKYSLLKSQEERNALGKTFGKMANSIQLSLFDFVHYENIPDENIQQQYQMLLDAFLQEYGRKDEQEVKRHLGMLFCMLPSKFQPKGLKSIIQEDSIEVEASANPSIAFTEDLNNLLPSKYHAEYSSSLSKYQIVPSISLYEIGVDDEFGQNAIATLFGPMASSPLERQNPDSYRDPIFYALLGMNGALACALTHSLVVPADVVKTRMQTTDRYENIWDGCQTIAKEEGLQGFTLGAEATVAGYFWYGLSVYPSYAFVKWLLANIVLDPAYATANGDIIALIAGAVAAVIASFGLTPLEACRIRTVAEPEIYRSLGLVGTMKVVAAEDSSSALGLKSLYAGLPSLMIRQVIFGSVKFLAFERVCEAFFLVWPFLRDSTATALGVTVVAGALSGALSSVVSQPADSVLTYIAKNKGDSAVQDQSSKSTFDMVASMIDEEGVSSLFRGLGSRCVWAAAIISGQFFLYDVFRTALGINNDDLSQIFSFVINTEGA